MVFSPPTSDNRTLDTAAVHKTLANAQQALLGSRVGGRWAGHLTSSALSTATAVIALIVSREARADQSGRHEALIDGGLKWLAAHQNADGGWGDTTSSPSNISTTVLAWAACSMNRRASESVRTAARAAESWIERTAGSLEPAAIASAIAARYGKDRTFSAPILTVCALAGRFGGEGWRLVPQLPFEVAACPREWFRRLRLPVVSYALPALIAIGRVRHHHRPTRNPAARLVRWLAGPRTVGVMEQIQPESGGFLEAVPLTSFVAMSLAASGEGDHVVVRRSIDFLARSVRDDGSWPIDTNLATWVTTLAVNALAAGGADNVLSPEERATIRLWLLQQQHRVVHAYTGARPGGWAWTDLAGGVPDADDTAGALLALRHLGPLDAQVTAAARAGIRWLLEMQNSDGGIPTFCRGWTNLPFDRSGPDLTAHALRAWAAWADDLSGVRSDLAQAAERAIRYLARTQQADGSWLPLWFGNQAAPGEHNPTYGTSRVLVALSGAAGLADPAICSRLARAGTDWLLAAQNTDGGWGGAARTPSSIEETALAISALAGRPRSSPSVCRDSPATLGFEPPDRPRREPIELAIDRGVAWLVHATDGGVVFPGTPIGLYFAKLWYSEELYPLIYTIAALRSVFARSGAPRM